MSAATDDPTGIPIPKDRLYLKNRQVCDLQDDIKELNDALENPMSSFGDRGAAMNQLRQLKHDLDYGSPPDTTPEQRDALAKERKRLIESIQDGMPSFQEMRRRPSGAVGKYDKHRRKKTPDQVRLKNILRIEHKGDDDPDVSNLEKFRPRTSTLNMDDAFIPAPTHFIPPDTQAYREGYERTFGPKEAQADPDEVAALRAQLDRLEKLIAEKPVSHQRQVKPVELMTSICGKTGLKGNAGKRVHELRCKKCLAIVEQGDMG